MKIFSNKNKLRVLPLSLLHKFSKRFFEGTNEQEITRKELSYEKKWYAETLINL